jgi:DNA-binding MurR/RpiR family transcriptional regulator
MKPTGKVQASTSAPDVLEHIKANFESLSPRLRNAARFVLDRPREIALYSMRQTADRAKVHPTSMLRLARELGFDGYEQFRDEFRDWLNKSAGATWSDRAQTVRSKERGVSKFGLIDSIIHQEVINLRSILEQEMYDSLVAAAKRVRSARNIYIIGLRSLYPVAFYFHYVCKMFMSNLTLINGLGGTFADELRNIGKGDVLIAFSYQPYTNETIDAVNFALSKGADLIAVTDSVVSPIAKKKSISMIVSNETPSLFPTIIPGLAVTQALTALLLNEFGDEVMAEIKRSENQLDAFNVYAR